MNFEVGMKAKTADGKIVAIESISSNHCYFVVRDEQGNASEISSQFLFFLKED